MKRHLPSMFANGDLTIGTVRYYIGTEKKTKCRDVKEALKTLIELHGVEETAAAAHRPGNMVRFGSSLKSREIPMNWQAF